MRDYSFNSSVQVLEVKASSELVVDEIIDHYERLFKDDSLPRNVKVCIDCRNVAFKMNVREITRTKEALIKTVQKYETINEAILVGKPFETVIATLFQDLSSDIDSYRFDVFSTKEAALDWLG